MVVEALFDFGVLGHNFATPASSCHHAAKFDTHNPFVANQMTALSTPSAFRGIPVRETIGSSRPLQSMNALIREYPSVSWVTCSESGSLFQGGSDSVGMHQSSNHVIISSAYPSRVLVMLVFGTSCLCYVESLEHY